MQSRKITPLFQTILFGRNGTSEDIADAVTFLFSEKARFITGCDVLVDGGIVTELLKSA